MIDKKQQELIPAIVQDHQTLNVLMLGYMNQESIDLTFKTKHVWFYSRSRNKLWEKGESSGNFLQLKQLVYDCDKDAILISAIPQGPTCHNGTYSCFNEFDPNALNVKDALREILRSVKTKKSYEYVKLKASYKRILAKDIKSKKDIPNYKNSAMDGYAVYINDTSKKEYIFSCVGQSFAGHPFAGKVRANEAIKVMTGALVPDNCNAVIMKELVDEISSINVNIVEVIHDRLSTSVGAGTAGVTISLETEDQNQSNELINHLRGKNIEFEVVS